VSPAARYIGFPPVLYTANIVIILWVRSGLLTTLRGPDFLEVHRFVRTVLAPAVPRRPKERGKNKKTRRNPPRRSGDAIAPRRRGLSMPGGGKARRRAVVALAKKSRREVFQRLLFLPRRELLSSLPRLLDIRPAREPAACLLEVALIDRDRQIFGEEVARLVYRRCQRFRQLFDLIDADRTDLFSIAADRLVLARSRSKTQPWRL